MSVVMPVVAVAFGSITPPQGDILELRVHLGCTKEVSSFDCLLQNFDKKYTVTNPINVGDNCYISIGRGANCPLILTGRVEEIQPESTPVENYIRVLGRCLGEKIFRRVVTKTYENQKGETIVKDLLGNYVGLSHSRTSDLTQDAVAGQPECVVADGSEFRVGDKIQISDDNNSEWNEVSSVSANTVTMVNNLAHTYTVLANGKVTSELVEDTDTTYTLLEYENTPVFDILKYIGESADKVGVIGYDFRLEYDGKFRFFPKNTKMSPISLSEVIEASRSSRDIHRIRNKIMVYGAAEKANPTDKDEWTDSANPNVESDLTQDAQAGQKIVNIEDGSKFAVSDKVLIMDNLHGEEDNVVASINVNQLTMENNLQYTYTVAASGKVIKVPGWYSGTGSGSISGDSTQKIVGSYSVKHTTNINDYWGNAVYERPADDLIDANKYPSLTFQLKCGSAFTGNLLIKIHDVDDNAVRKLFSIQNNDEWQLQSFPVGKKNTDNWTHLSATFDWAKVKKIEIRCNFSGTGTGSFWIDNLFFNQKRWEATREDLPSQSSYGLRELVEVDEELHSDNECDLRAKALLDHLGDPAELLTLQTTCLDYGTNRLLPGDKIHVTLPNENIDADFRIISVECNVIARDQTLEITLELGKEKPLLADYLYGLRATTVTVEKLMRTKAGPTGVAGSAGGGGGGGGAGVSSLGEYGDSTTLTGHVKLEEGTNVTIERVDANNSLKISAAGGGGGSENFNLPIYLGDVNMFVSNKVLSGSGGGLGAAALGATVYYVAGGGGASANETRAFYPEFRHCAFTVDRIRFDRKRDVLGTGTKTTKYRIYIDKIDKDGTVTNLYDSTEITCTNETWTSQDIDVNLSVSQTDVLRIRLYGYASGSALSVAMCIRGFRLVCVEA